MASASEKNSLISLMIVGAQKAGTTSLLRYLGEHPQLQAHLQKEFSYFYNLDEFSKGYDAALEKYFYAHGNSQKLIAKNAGLYVSEAGISRLRESNPGCQLVLLLRNPIDRTYSAYQMERNYGHLHEPFSIMEKVVKQADSTDWRFEFLVGMSQYYQHLEMIYRYFPKEQVNLVDFDNLRKNPLEVCQRFFRLLGVDENFRPDVNRIYNETRTSRSRRYARFISTILDNDSPLKKIARAALPSKADYKIGTMLRGVNVSSQRPGDISPEMRNFFREYYKPFNRQLEKLTGTSFAHWDE